MAQMAGGDDESQDGIAKKDLMPQAHTSTNQARPQNAVLTIFHQLA